MVTIDGRALLYFSGTGYLGLQSRPQVIEALAAAAARSGVHCATSRLRAGVSPALREAELEAAAFFGTDTALTCASGYLSPWMLLQAIADLAGLARAVLPVVPAGAVVLGWSLGGMVALELARRQPSLVRALVLVATTPRFVAGDDWEHGTRSEVLDGFARGLADDYRGTVRNFLALQTLGDEHATQALRTLRQQLASHGEPDPLALAAGLDILRAVDLRDALPHIACPALAIAGEHDRLTPPAAGRELATRLPAARFQLVARAGHAPFLSHPAEVLAEVLPFLARCGAAP